MACIFRIAIIEDIDRIANLYVEQFCAMKNLMAAFFQVGEQSKEFLQNIIQADDSEILVLIVDDEISGFILLQEKETPDFPFFVKHRYAYLMDIIITSKDRGKGMGKAFIEEAKKWAMERRLEYIELDVLSNNDTAINLYNRLGFTDKKKVMYCDLGTLS